jgi:hypothetical protein
MGALYGLVEKKLPLSAPVKGVLLSLEVWACSYLRLLSLIGISASGLENGKSEPWEVDDNATIGKCLIRSPTRTNQSADQAVIHSRLMGK